MTVGQYIDTQTEKAKELYKKAANNKIVKALFFVGLGAAASQLYNKIKK